MFGFGQKFSKPKPNLSRIPKVRPKPNRNRTEPEIWSYPTPRKKIVSKFHFSELSVPKLSNCLPFPNIVFGPFCLKNCAQSSSRPKTGFFVRLHAQPPRARNEQRRRRFNGRKFDEKSVTRSDLHSSALAICPNRRHNERRTFFVDKFRHGLFTFGRHRFGPQGVGRRDYRLYSYVYVGQKVGNVGTSVFVILHYHVYRLYFTVLPLSEKISCDQSAYVFTIICTHR